MIPLSVSTNVATFQTSPGFSWFTAFYAEAGFETENDDKLLLFLYEANMVSDDEEEDAPEEPEQEPDPEIVRKEWGFERNNLRFHPDTNIPAIPESQTQIHIPTPTLFNLDEPNTALEGAYQRIRHQRNYCDITPS
eukprot:scaffold19845_cov34-Attheya_sp.AAC.5